MRLIKTVANEAKTDILNFVKLLNLKVICCTLAIAVMFAVMVTIAHVLEAALGISPEVTALIAVTSTVGTSGFLYWCVTLVNRARSRINSENKQILNALR